MTEKKNQDFKIFDDNQWFKIKLNFNEKIEHELTTCQRKGQPATWDL